MPPPLSALQCRQEQPEHHRKLHRINARCQAMNEPLVVDAVMRLSPCFILFGPASAQK